MKQFYYMLQKVIFLVAFFTLFATLSKAQTLTISTVDAGPYTPGSSIAVPFTITSGNNCISPDNVYKLYISSVPGGTPDIEIGSYTGFYATFLNGTIPANLAPGNGYNLAIKSSLPAVTSSTASINIVAGTAVQAAIAGSSINSDNPEIFGNCSGTTDPYYFGNASTSGSAVTATFRNELTQTNETTVTLNPSTAFNANYANYTILVKATQGGHEGTKAYQLINNNLNTNFGTSGSNTVCLSGGHGTLSYTVDYTSPNGIEYNYPGNLYVVNWGDGSTTIYTLCDIINLSGRLTHDYTQSSCGYTGGGQTNSFQVNAQVSSRICGTLGSPTSVYAKVVRPPSNNFTAQLSACLNEPVSFTNTSDPGQDASSANCSNNNAKYTWFVDGVAIQFNYTLGTPFTYTFTSPGQHTVTLKLQNGSSGACGASDVTKTICVLAKPQPQFALAASTICSNDVVSPTDQSTIDPSCDNIPQNNAYTWSVTGPATAAFINNTTPASHNPQIKFSSPGIYTLTLSIGTENCGAVSTSQTITVNTTPTVTLSPNKDYCGTNQTLTFANNVGDTQTIFTGTTTDQANTYSWTVTGGAYSYQNGTSASSKYPQILFTDFGVYTVTATETNNCGSASASQQLNFKQSPTINAGPDQTICPNGIVQLAGTITGPPAQSYQWTGGNGTFSPGRTSLTATYTPSNAEIDAGQVKLTLVVITGNPVPCDQLSDEIIITINPRNSVTSSSSQSICTGNTVGYHPTAQVTASTFTWTSSASATVTGNTATGSGDINDVLTNSDPLNNGTVTYTITPSSNGCPGTSFTLTVTVTPRPIITVNSTANTICSGQPAGITFTSNLSGTTFKWTTSASSGIYGNNSQSPVVASRVDDVLSNTSTTAAGTATYTITPIGPSGCEGTPVTVTITVQPLPVQANAGPDGQICSAPTYVLQGNNPGISSGRWSLVSSQTGVVFADATQYNTTVSGLQGGQSYTFRWTITGAAQCAVTSDDVIVNDLSDLTNTISFASPAVCSGQTVTVSGDLPTGGTNSYVYSWESSSDGLNWASVSGQSGANLSMLLTSSIYFRRIVTSGPCVKTSNVIYIQVQPPISNNTVTANQQICYNNTPSVLNGSTPAGGDGSYSYQWQQSIDNGANWNTISGATSINYQPVSLITTTQFRRIVTTALCSGAQQNVSNVVTVTVSPQNTNTVTSASSATICTGATFSYHITAQAANTSFTWVSSASGTVSGNTASGTGDINDVLTNTDANNNGTVTYTITPFNSGCPGRTFTLTVTVTPLPVITVNQTSNTICSGQPTGITFTANLSGTKFKWTSTASAGISGNNNQAAVYASRIDDVLNNSSSTASGTVTYQIIPVSASGCEGVPVTVIITVQPLPLQANAGPDEQICSTSSYTLKGNNPGISSGNWTIISGQTGISFADYTQYNTTVNGLQPGQQYTFRWTITGASQCASSLDDVIITDLLDLTNNISFVSPAVCYGQTITINGDQPTGGTNSYVYSWESSSDGINWTSIASQNGRNLSFTGTANIYIRRIVSSGPCVKVSQPVYVIVQPPIANNTITADQRICYNDVPALLTGSTPTGGDGNFTYQWQNSTDGGTTWLGISNSNTITYQPGALTATTQYRRVVSTALCSGSQHNISNAVTITVNPPNTNTITSASTKIICTGTALSYHPTAQQNNTSFTWVSSASASVTGNSASGTGDINDVLVNADPNNNGTVTYTITPINNNCPGTPFTLTVTVTPIPRVTLTNSGNQICSGSPTGITFTTNTPGVLLKWTSANVQGIYGNAVNQQPVIATRIDDILISDLTTAATIVYHITPISPGGCEGPTVDASVTVLPQPVQANAGADEQICSASNYVLKGNNPAPSAGKWTLTSGQTGVGFADDTQYNTTVNGLQPGQSYTFRWTITSTGACSTSADDVTISDLRDLTNTISFNSTAVCYGQTVTALGDQPTGGTGSFVYSWESSTDQITWTTIANQTGKDYSFTGTQNLYIRRIVTSGPCTKISQPVYIIVQPPITNNTVASDQEVCYNNTPKLLNGSAPAGADGNYTYNWQSSTDNGATWTNISGANTANYQVNSLTVTTQFRRIVTSVLCNGPQQSVSNIITVTVNPLPNATYTYKNDLGCIPFKLDAQNINATAAAGNNTYTWYADGVFFGSGFTFPGYTITEDNKQVVIKLVVSSKYGCPDASFTHTFTTIKEVTAGFTQDQTKGCGPLTVTFTNTSNPQNAATYTWNFGNGSTSTQVNPLPVTFLPRTDGKDTTYTVTLKALTACGIRTFTSGVTVRPKPISIFTPDKTVGCSPFTVNFNNTSPGTNNTYTFDFGDGQTLVTHDNQGVAHIYTSAVSKTYVVKMTATNECGTSVTQYNIRISPNSVFPQLVVNGDQKAGCAPWTVQFYNNTKGGTYFTYDFGDGTIVNTQSAPEVVSHTFLKDGVFNVKLSATNGCSDTSTYQSITVYPQPKTSFTADVQSGCKQLTVNFKNQTTGDNTYMWDFGDGGTAVSPNPTHTFTARNTPFTITLIAKNGLGCTDTLTMKNYINVYFPPKAAFAAKPDSVIAYPYYSFSFADKSTNNPILWKWNFGDGISASKQNPEHTYRDTGIYKVQLIVYNLQGCADSITHTVQITGVPGQLFVPNAFMPTSKFNEIVTFKAKGSGIKRWHMRVFNKWGQVIWETTKLTARGEPAEGWDGMMNGQPAPQGVYVWEIEATYLNGNEWMGMSYKNSAPSRTGVIHLIK
ncbi:PKD-like domain-containing protein [Mucilaginibacter arboris]|uniref:PKD domain-containing protein n=1 Tax=Mucilaginibacter arboris TaxID=2682090 RepID=A0A7K1SU18_9SPHI|nr:PKD-like domain-containing protein [Mucilaginibacter arboris]MVN20805.1 PKD domain-containing protein [Mucilaginibacter arboris]